MPDEPPENLSVYWFLPSHGDGRTLSRRADRGGRGGAHAAQRPADLSYLAQVAGAVETLGFDGMLVPTGLFCEDPWLVVAALAQRTERVRFMVAVRPSLLSPVLAAQMAATAQRLTGNRLQLNVVSGGDAGEQARYGDWLDHDERYAQSAEFLTILRAVSAGEAVDFQGQYFHVKDALLTRPAPVAAPVFVGGSSSAARQVAARLADVYLAWGETPTRLREIFAAVHPLAERYDRRIALGTRFHVICRDDAAQAWAVADRMVADLDPAMVAAAQARARRADSVGQRRAADLYNGRAEPGGHNGHSEHSKHNGRLEVYPNVWAGFGLLRPGAGAALVGDHHEVAERIAEYHALGVRHLILSGQPHLEEAYWFGEGVMPLLRARGLVNPPLAGPVAAGPSVHAQTPRSAPTSAPRSTPASGQDVAPHGSED